MPTVHVPAKGEPILCHRERFGRCRICELIDPAHPDFSPDYLALFDPKESIRWASEPPVPVPQDPAGQDDTRRKLGLVRDCPSRGSTLNVSEQPPCGCRELTECRAAKGPPHRTGAVTLRECLDCVDHSFSPILATQ